mmetsp:Transcript_5724/g.13700  ORF Transcript_5724/g.13700 Transcript_5724/m.13700 type:complete len:430 (-) Transcript_5724:247-1536(-)
MFQIQDGIDHVLDHSGSRNVSRFRNVTNRQNRYFRRLGQSQEKRHGFANLRNSSGAGRSTCLTNHGLDGINHNETRRRIGWELILQGRIVIDSLQKVFLVDPVLYHIIGQGIEIGFRQQKELLRQGIKPGRTLLHFVVVLVLDQPLSSGCDLFQCFLSRHVPDGPHNLRSYSSRPHSNAHRSCRKTGHLGGHLEGQRRLSDTGISSQENQGSLHQTSSQDLVHFLVVWNLQSTRVWFIEINVRDGNGAIALVAALSRNTVQPRLSVQLVVCRSCWCSVRSAAPPRQKIVGGSSHRATRTAIIAPLYLDFLKGVPFLAGGATTPPLHGFAPAIRTDKDGGAGLGRRSHGLALIWTRSSLSQPKGGIHARRYSEISNVYLRWVVVVVIFFVVFVVALGVQSIRLEIPRLAKIFAMAERITRSVPNFIRILN